MILAARFKQICHAAHWPIDRAVLLLRWSGLIAADVS